MNKKQIIVVGTMLVGIVAAGIFSFNDISSRPCITHIHFADAPHVWEKCSSSTVYSMWWGAMRIIGGLILLIGGILIVLLRDKTAKGKIG
ncbi:MAG: hypothetical protein KBA46_00200 [Candidatus Omnitrophica bacterium]|nr:hypothetical protein [Candidatus Omnitrophota bacterium]